MVQFAVDVLLHAVCVALTVVLLISPCFAQGPPVDVSTLAGDTALLPCDVTPPLSDDSVILVIWFRNQMKPIYSYDRRGPHREQAAHWHDKHARSKLFFFRTITQPATLALEDADASDAGEYRCRVDFEQSPTRNAKVRLFVIVPPQRPIILDEVGNQLMGSAGPYEEGNDLRITCIVKGGPPPPTVGWYSAELFLESLEVPDAFTNIKRLQLVIRRLTRADLRTMYTCRAFNNDITPPVNTSVSVDMILPPLSASILNSRQPLSAGRRYELTCQAMGSRPTAHITWWLDSQALDSDGEETSFDGNMTLSHLQLLLEPNDDGRTLTCRANNPLLPTGVQEDSWRLQVYYQPTLRLQLGTGLNPDDIEEGDDVYFECIVHSNPRAYKVVWKHNGQSMADDRKSGVVQVSQDLALQAVRRHHAGNYSCVASNVEGDGESNTVVLRVMFPPECRLEQQRVYGVAPHEETHVRCEVDAYPASVDFRWSFNLSGELSEVPGARMHTETTSTGAVSVLTYTPSLERDFGPLLCSAANVAGRQREPCVFHVVPAGQPDPPFNCSVVNRSADSLEIECEPGFDGGARQQFLLEAYEESNGALAANMSSATPHFMVTGLRAGSRLKLLLWAANARGRSESLAVGGTTLQTAQKHTDTPGSSGALSPALAAAAGAAVALLLVAATAVVRVRGQAARHRARSNEGRTQELVLKEKAAVAAAGATRRGSRDLQRGNEERNPDIIPYGKDVAFHPLASTPASLHSPPETTSQGEIRLSANGPGGTTETEAAASRDNRLNARLSGDVTNSHPKTSAVGASEVAGTPSPTSASGGPPLTLTVAVTTALPSGPVLVKTAPANTVNHLGQIVTGGLRHAQKVTSPGANQPLPPPVPPREIVTLRASTSFSSQQESSV